MALRYADAVTAPYHPAPSVSYLLHPVLAFTTDQDITHRDVTRYTYLNLLHRRPVRQGKRSRAKFIERTGGIYSDPDASRPDPIKRVRIDHIDLRKRQLFIPTPKGGEEKAFCILLSRQMIRCICRARKFGRMMHPEQATEWLFPAESGPGHVHEHKEDRSVLTHWGNDLRRPTAPSARSPRSTKSICTC
jgi:hypothetical protein